MRSLYLMRGAPGAGKDHLINKHGLQDYSLSADNIRLLLESPVLLNDGSFGISQKNDNKVWQLLFEILEQRMKRGEFVIINATHSKESDAAKYKKFIDKYRYRAYYVDLSDVPLEVLKGRNASRSAIKFVPEHVIDNMYARMQSQKLPNYIKRVTPEEFAEHHQFKKLKFDQYEKIVIIGDLHGCYQPLANYFSEHSFSDKNFYIFLGDYVDRGIQHKELFELLLPLSKKENSLFLTGNHDLYLKDYTFGDEVRSRQFLTKTLPQLSEMSTSDLRDFCRRLAQCAYFEFRGVDYFCSHAGISTLPDNLNLIATDTFIRGVGRYEDLEEIAETWKETTNAVQFFGHRGMELPAKLNGQCYCLEDNVEFGGNLRIAELNKAGIEVLEYKNEIFKLENVPSKISLTSDNFYDILTGDKDVKVKEFDNGILSVNFKNSVFYKRKWSERTLKARGLFLLKENKSILARSYDKFFNIGELQETELHNLRTKLHFPVTAYEKANGFLGLLSWNDAEGKFFFSSKTSPTSDFTKYFRDILCLNTIDVDVVHEQCRQGYTLVFEVIDVERDPHIIKYDQSHCVLLDCVKNSLDFAKLPYEELVKLAERSGLTVKNKFAEFPDFESFRLHYEMMETLPLEMEGFVYEDASGFMVKHKVPFYQNWKFLRSVKDRVRRNRRVNPSSLQTPLENLFYAWCKKQSFETLSQPIIELRDLFLEEGNG